MWDEQSIVWNPDFLLLALTWFGIEWFDSLQLKGIIVHYFLIYPGFVIIWACCWSSCEDHVFMNSHQYYKVERSRLHSIQLYSSIKFRVHPSDLLCLTLDKYHTPKLWSEREKAFPKNPDQNWETCMAYDSILPFLLLLVNFVPKSKQSDQREHGWIFKKCCTVFSAQQVHMTKSSQTFSHQIFAIRIYSHAVVSSHG